MNISRDEFDTLPRVRLSTMANKRGFGSVYQKKKRTPNGNMVTLPTWWIKY